MDVTLFGLRLTCYSYCVYSHHAYHFKISKMFHCLNQKLNRSWWVKKHGRQVNKLRHFPFKRVLLILQGRLCFMLLDFFPSSIQVDKVARLQKMSVGILLQSNWCRCIFVVDHVTFILQVAAIHWEFHGNERARFWWKLARKLEMYYTEKCGAMMLSSNCTQKSNKTISQNVKLFLEVHSLVNALEYQANLATDVCR